MAESEPSDGSSTSDICGGSESTLQLNVKTLDSQIFSFRVDKNMLVSALKEKIAAQSSVPVGQQRLIFRGKLLKDDHLISEYNLENEDTLHLVERQPQPSPGDATSSNGNRATAQDAAGELLQRIGPIAQSIVLGTLNVGDPSEAAVPDLSQVIGAVLNTIGISNPTGGLQPVPPVASHGNAAEELQNDAGSENQGGNQSIPWQAFHGPSSSHAMQTPLGAAVPVPDSLSTMVEFLNQMEMVFSPNGDQHNQSTASGSTPSNTTVLPQNSHGLQTVEGLSIVLQQAQRLLGEHAVPAISRTATRLNQERGSNDPAVREQVQTESIQLGMALHHLGALFLELGRTVLTLHMGQSPAESFVNAGPAVYISPSGPNPIMVQPFPLQTAFLFGGSSGVSKSPAAVTPVGFTGLPRNVNIHIQAGNVAPATSAAANRDEGMQGQRADATQPVDFGQAHDSTEVNSTEAESNSRNRSSISGTYHQPECEPSVASEGGSHERTSTSKQGDDNPGGSSGIPIGLGTGGLQPKTRGKQPRPKPEAINGSSADSRNHEAISVGQQVLQSLASLSPQTVRPNVEGQNNTADAMSQLLQGPALDDLLAGVSNQAGAGSPDMLRNMLQQFAENPAMRSTVNQIAQQVDSHDIESILSGLDDGSGGGGGGIDLSRMMQQMMPIVSRALGGVTSVSQLPTEPTPSSSSSRRGITGDHDDPQEVFHSLVEGAVNLLGDGGTVENLVNELPRQEGLAQEFMEMFQRDVSRRFRDDMGS